MDAELFLSLVEGLGVDFFAGVPDSLLAPLCDTLYRRYGAKHRRHVVAANEGGAVGLHRHRPSWTGVHAEQRDRECGEPDRLAAP